MENNQQDKDSYILDLMRDVYKEDEKRNELIDKQNSQMIILVTAILTLQITLSSNLLLQYVLKNHLIHYNFKLVIVFVFVFSLVFILVSLLYFAKAYKFTHDFEEIPSSEYLLNVSKSDVSLEEFKKELIENFDDTIRKNEKTIDEKLNEGKQGFFFLKISIMLVFIFILLLILSLF